MEDRKAGQCAEGCIAKVLNELGDARFARLFSPESRVKNCDGFVVKQVLPPCKDAYKRTVLETIFFDVDQKRWDLSYRETAQRAKAEEDIRIDFQELRSSLIYAHPNVMRIFDAIVYAGDMYMAMDNMKAGSLKDMLIGRGIDEAPLAGITWQVCDGLNYLHKEANRVHDNLKTSNILLNFDGLVKISDWGVAGNTTVGRSSWNRGRQAGSLPPGDDITDLGIIIHFAYYGTGPQLPVKTPKFDAPQIDWFFNMILQTLIAARCPSARHVQISPWVIANVGSVVDGSERRYVADWVQDKHPGTSRSSASSFTDRVNQVIQSKTYSDPLLPQAPASSSSYANAREYLRATKPEEVEAFVARMRRDGHKNWVVHKGAPVNLEDPDIENQLSETEFAELLTKAFQETEVVEPLSASPVPIPVQPAALDKYISIADQVLSAIEDTRYTKNFGEMLVRQLNQWPDAASKQWAMKEEAWLIESLVNADSEQSREDLRKRIENSLLTTLREVKAEVVRGSLAGLGSNSSSSAPPATTLGKASPSVHLDGAEQSEFGPWQRALATSVSPIWAPSSSSSAARQEEIELQAALAASLSPDGEDENDAADDDSQDSEDMEDYGDVDSDEDEEAETPVAAPAEEERQPTSHCSAPWSLVPGVHCRDDAPHARAPLETACSLLGVDRQEEVQSSAKDGADAAHRRVPEDKSLHRTPGAETPSPGQPSNKRPQGDLAKLCCDGPCDVWQTRLSNGSSCRPKRCCRCFPRGPSPAVLQTLSAFWKENHGMKAPEPSSGTWQYLCVSCAAYEGARAGHQKTQLQQVFPLPFPGILLHTERSADEDGDASSQISEKVQQEDWDEIRSLADSWVDAAGSDCARSWILPTAEGADDGGTSFACSDGTEVDDDSPRASRCGDDDEDGQKPASDDGFTMVG